MLLLRSVLLTVRYERSNVNDGQLGSLVMFKCSLLCQFSYFFCNYSSNLQEYIRTDMFVTAAVYSL